jgi:hypothetical protein
LLRHSQRFGKQRVAVLNPYLETKPNAQETGGDPPNNTYAKALAKIFRKVHRNERTQSLRLYAQLTQDCFLPFTSSGDGWLLR